MKILGIETSCDETSAAIIEAKPRDKRIRLLSNVVASSLSLHSKTGGIIPEIAAREQVKYIIPVVTQALKEAGIRHSGKSVSRWAHPESPTVIRDAGQASMTVTIDAIAVTVGPGLIGSLLVGVETAKTLAYVWKKPIIPVNHLIGHIYANFIQTTDDRRQKTDFRKTDHTDSLSSVLAAIRLPSSVIRHPIFPLVALIVSGGHTDLVLMRNHGKIKWLGGTRDDAAGEAFDKIGRLLGLPYPGGPSIEKFSKDGDPKAFQFPRPMIDSNDFDFSFSGLKTAVWREVNLYCHSEGAKRPKNPLMLSTKLVADISASVQQSIIDVLVAKTLKAGQKYKVKSILLGGGVAANQKLRDDIILNTKYIIPNTAIFAPQKSLCTDNAAMIASAAFFNYKPMPWQKLIANPELYFDTT